MMKLGLVCIVLAIGVAHAQDYYYGVDPAPSMAAAQAGMPLVNEQGQAIPAAPSMDAIMAGNAAAAGAPYLGNPQMASGFAPQPMFVEQMQPQVAQAPAAAPFAVEEAQMSEEDEEEGTDETADSEEGAEEDSTDEEQSEGGEAVEADAGADARFAVQKGFFGSLKRKLKRAGSKMKAVGKKVGKKALQALLAGGKLTKKALKKVLQALKAGGKLSKKALKKVAAAAKKAGLKIAANLRAQFKRNGKPLVKPHMGKPNNQARSPSAKTPAAAGKKLPPMPAPLPKPFQISCKKNPALCINAETPAEGEKPGDHSPKAVFKKKMEVIKKSLMINNRNIAQELKWIDQVELIMKQYSMKVKKVKEHVADERKAIKELLRQRRIILNEKKQKELEQKLKMATTELAALTDALQQVQKKEKELGSGKGQLGAKIKLLVGDLKKLRTDKQLDEAQSLKKAE